jgi:hypothetical protein
MEEANYNSHFRSEHSVTKSYIDELSPCQLDSRWNIAFLVRACLKVSEDSIVSVHHNGGGGGVGVADMSNISGP